jgi:hypothetical protein
MNQINTTKPHILCYIPSISYYKNKDTEHKLKEKCIFYLEYIIEKCIFVPINL